MASKASIKSKPAGVYSASALAGALTKSRSQSKFEQLASWMDRIDKAAKAPGSKASVDSFFAKQGATAAKPLPPIPSAKDPEPVAKPREKTWEEKQEIKNIMKMAEEGLNSRFSDMYKAFQYVDLDRSGRLNKKEIARAMDMWNIPMDDRKLDLLLGECDADGDGGISYEEFVDKLARETVAPDAMGKRGKQSAEAMGVSAFEMMDEQLGHNQFKQKFNPSINA